MASVEGFFKEGLGFSATNSLANNIQSLMEGKGFTSKGLDSWQDLAVTGGVSTVSGILRGGAANNSWLATAKKEYYFPKDRKITYEVQQ